MKIGETRPVSGVGGTRREKDATARYQKAAALGDSAPVDSTSILGIPETELTPKVRSAIMTLMAEVDRLRQELEQTKGRLGNLEQLADQDTLAPVANRRAFVRELSRVISYSERYKAPSSLVYFDLNAFKSINDSMGHAAGDAALLHVAKLLVDNIRESDVVGRLGGDEFGVILAHADEAQAQEKAVSLVQLIADTPVEFNGKVFHVQLAYGISTFAGGESVSDAIAAADRAMYANKAAGKKAAAAK
ncbi:MAG: GGDEF domain-containing protein [Alphaproteobacteria bacterium]